MFDIKEFEEDLGTSWLGHSFYYFDDLQSTNSYAKKLSNENSLHGTVVLTDHQTGGRGQYKRKWNTKAGKNLTFSLIFEPPKAERLCLLTLACALAVKDSLEHFGEASCHIKWPNDILCGQKKLCGILTETVFSGNNLERVVVGIGLNVNQTEFGEELDDIAISIKQAANRESDIEREKLLSYLLQRIEFRYRMWSQHNTDLIKQINHKLDGYGEWRRLQVDGNTWEGDYKFLGVNEAGELLALNKALDIKSFSYEQVRIL